MESHPIDASVVAFQYEFDYRVGISEDICLVIRPSHLIFKTHGCGSGMLLSQATYIPYSHRLIQAGRYNQVLRWMPLGAHDIVVMSGHRTDQAAVLPVPDADSLVIGAGQNPNTVSGIREGMPLSLPWLFMVEEHSPDYSNISAVGQDLYANFCLP